MHRRKNGRATWLTIAVCLLAAFFVVPSSASAAPGMTSNTGFTYAGAWASLSGEHYANQKGATAALTFTVGPGGGTVSLRSAKHSNNGYASVSIDGRSETRVSLHSRGQENNARVYMSSRLTAGRHTMKVRVTGEKPTQSNNTLVSVTRADVLNGSISAPTAPSSTAPSSTAQAAAPSGVTLDLDWDTCNNSQWTAGSGGIEAGDPAHQYQISSAVTRSGSGCAARFEVHNASSDQVSNGSFRALASKYDTQDGAVAGEDFTYGFSFRVPSIPGAEQIWELHQRSNIYSVDGDLSLAPHAVLLRDGRIEYRMMTGKARWDGSQWTGYESYNDRIVLDPSAQANAWYDMTVRVKASEGASGLVEVFIRKAGQAWPATPIWTKTGPTVQWIPGGLSPNVPTKRSSFDSDGGYSGLFLEMGICNSRNTWATASQQVLLYVDELRRYTNVAAAKAGFPA